MKNNKGFSIIELIVSFTICTVIMIILFQIVLVLKELYEKSAIKTTLLNKQNIITNLIYKDILEKGLNNADSCGEYCIEFIFNDNSTEVLEYISDDNGTLSYGDYVTEVLGGTTVNEVEVSFQNNIISAKMPLTHKLFNNKDFGINIVHYKST